MTKSPLHEKLARGMLPEDVDVYRHIYDGEGYRYGDTEHAFVRLRTDSGLNAFEYLIDGVEDWQHKIVLDLPCGSGYLAALCAAKVGPKGHVYGIDTSHGEIALARRQHPSANITYLCERAQQLSLADQSIDLCFCHMSLMILRPLQPVIQQIGRVLRPSGSFIFNIFQDQSFHALPSSLFSELFRLSQRYEATVPGFQAVGWGELHTSSPEAIAALFCQITDDVVTAAESVDYLLTLREPSPVFQSLIPQVFQIGHLLFDEYKASYRAELQSVLAGHQAVDGTIALQIPMRRITLQKRT